MLPDYPQEQLETWQNTLLSLSCLDLRLGPTTLAQDDGTWALQNWTPKSQGLRIIPYQNCQHFGGLIYFNCWTSSESSVNWQIRGEPSTRPSFSNVLRQFQFRRMSLLQMGQASVLSLASLFGTQFSKKVEDHRESSNAQQGSCAGQGLEGPKLVDILKSLLASS